MTKIENTSNKPTEIGKNSWERPKRLPRHNPAPPSKPTPQKPNT